ncbi:MULTISPECIES: heavy metal sensor histidine kinase [Pseudomonadota]|uniref:heavy metal sensor histidine kinase n=1 Tax=Pseudomonadota TaxID=1224 RepID=UPI002AFEE30B|nr:MULTISPECIES: heavy metal sensor histidine kinase [Pseudomonadota]
MKHPLLQSLTARTAILFAIVSCMVVSGLGLYLYAEAKQALETRADYTLVGRVERFRTLLQDLYNIRQMEKRPDLFESMLGNEQDVRIFQRVGEKPFIDVNPGHMTIPSLTAVPVDQDVGIDALRAGTRADGVGVRWVSALAKVGGQDGTVKITAAYVMTQESQMLKAYWLRVMGAIALAALLSSILGFLFLKRGLGPLEVMGKRARQVSSTNLAVRLPEEDMPSELRQLARSCNAMLDRIQSGYEHLSQFSSDLAHEIRTPVNVLMGQTQVALAQPRSAADYEALLASNLEELTRITHIVENILFLSRADHNAIALERQPIALAQELEKIAEYFEGLADERGMSFAVEADGTGYANIVMCRRAVNNLVINAIRYGDADTRIRLAAYADRQGFTVAVENHCPPVTQEEAGRMFRRFYRGDASRSLPTESNGLGLAIVAAIMDIHGGGARVETCNDGRILFCLDFPVERMESTLSGLGHADHHASRRRIRTGPMSRSQHTGEPSCAIPGKRTSCRPKSPPKPSGKDGGGS